MISIESIDEVVKCSLGDNNFLSEVVGEIDCVDGKNILLLLEGWDEFPEERQHISYFTNLISRKVLKKCDVLITSRPSSIGSIQKRFIIHHIAILMMKLNNTWTTVLLIRIKRWLKA